MNCRQTSSLQMRNYPVTVSTFILVSLLAVFSSYCDGIGKNIDQSSLDKMQQELRSPCKYRVDVNLKNGISVDCSGLKLERIKSTWFPSSTTEIYLNDNLLTTIDDYTFDGVKDLRVLSISKNKLNGISPGAFAKLTHLEQLNLNHNELRLDRLDNITFLSLSKLKSLDLVDNGNYNEFSKAVYPPNLLKGLIELKSLSLTTFPGDLEFGELFQESSSLKHLELSGYVMVIKNNSFKSFRNIALESLKLSFLNELQSTEIDAFRFLTHLQYLYLGDTSQGVSKTLQSMYAFQNRNLTTLIFYNVTPRKPSSLEDSNAILDVDKTKYLSNICVKHFTFSNSIILFVESRVFLSDMWAKCLVSIDLVGLPIIEIDHQFAFQMYSLRSLRHLRIEDCKYHLFGVHTPGREVISSLKLSQFNGGLGDFWGQHKVKGKHGNISINLPPLLENFTFSACGRSSNSIDKTIYFNDAHNLRVIKLKDNAIVSSSGQIIGISRLEYMDLSFNSIQYMNPKIFDTLPSLKILKLVSVYANGTFLSSLAQRLFGNLNQLETLDLSSNELSYLEPDSFSRCTQLRELDLSRNKLIQLTLDISALAHLHVVDLSFNSITKLTHPIIQSLDDLNKRVPNLTVYMEGNPLTCECSSLRFLLWLNRTSIYLDKNRNFRCLDQDGVFVTTHTLVRDPEAMWRKCHVNDAFFLSLLICFLFILTFFLIYFYSNFKSFIVNTLFRLFAPHIKLNVKADFRHGVFIGYADEDYKFVCFDLRRFLEEKLKINTYIRHRDQFPNDDIAESIVESINSSWRVLLILTRHFLQLDGWSYFTVKNAAYSVNQFNPGKIIIIADRDIFQQIPAFLLKITPEENIIEMEMPFQMRYEERDALKNAIL